MTKKPHTSTILDIVISCILLIFFTGILHLIPFEAWFTKDAILGVILLIVLIGTLTLNIIIDILNIKDMRRK